MSRPSTEFAVFTSDNLRCVTPSPGVTLEYDARRIDDTEPHSLVIPINDTLVATDAILGRRYPHHANRGVLELYKTGEAFARSLTANSPRDYDPGHDGPTWEHTPFHQHASLLRLVSSTPLDTHPDIIEYGNSHWCQKNLQFIAEPGKLTVGVFEQGTNRQILDENNLQKQIDNPLFREFLEMDPAIRVSPEQPTTIPELHFESTEPTTRGFHMPGLSNLLEAAAEGENALHYRPIRDRGTSLPGAEAFGSLLDERLRLGLLIRMSADSKARHSKVPDIHLARGIDDRFAVFDADGEVTYPSSSLRFEVRPIAVDLNGDWNVYQQDRAILPARMQECAKYFGEIVHKISDLLIRTSN